MAKTILFIYPYFYSYEFSAGPIQCRRFINALADDGYNIIIVSGDGNVKVGKDYKSYTVKEKDSPILRKLVLKFCPDLINLPDYRRWSYMPQLYRAAQKAINENKIDYILTNSFPCSDHLVGLKLKKKYNIKWIAQFYDPWVGNPFRPIKNKKLRKYDERLEKDVVTSADLILHTNDVIEDIWTERYGDIVKNKMFVLPFVTPEINKNPLVPKSNKKITFSYIGSLQYSRNIESLVKAIEQLKDKHPNLSDLLEIRIIGPTHNYNKDLVSKSNLYDIFNFIGKMGPDELDDYYINSDGFIAIDNPIKRSPFFPSKLIDYFGYKKPILGITPKDSCTSRILTDAGHIAIDNENHIEMMKYFESIINNGYDSLQYDKNYIHNFDKQVVIDRFLSILERI